MTGPELRELRRVKGWTQVRLAVEAGIEKSEISHYELGIKPISRLGARLFTLLLSPQWLLTNVQSLVPGGGGNSAASRSGDSKTAATP